ncbi:MAG: ankyrin repeat domain-containing protein [Terracidiphilus sp.]
MNAFHCRQVSVLQIAISRRVAFALLLLAALASGPLGFCGPIHAAARDGDLKTVESLLKEHPDLVSSKDEKYGQTPLHIAAFSDHADVAKLLIADKADVNAKANNGSTPLHLAAAKGNKDMVELLLASGADVNAVDHDGWSPLHSATTWGHKDIEDLLRQHNAEDLLVPKPPVKAPTAQSTEKAPPKETGKDDRFIAYSDSTVLDTKTNLMWSERDSGVAQSWPDAKSYARNFHGGGYSDWRLPTLTELAGLYDKTKNRKTYCAAAVDELGAAADDAHIATDWIRLSCTREWTSQEKEDQPGSATIFDFHSGNDAGRPGSPTFVDTASRVLLVRTKQ